MLAVYLYYRKYLRMFFTMKINNQRNVYVQNWLESTKKDFYNIGMYKGQFYNAYLFKRLLTND